jgi:CRISPR system Cascade subunit CasC
LVWLAESEVRDLARRIADEMTNKNLDVADLDGWVQATTASLTIAGFGRMFANTPNLQTEAAAQVAHAFTTHAAVIEIDYFSAVDDERRRYTDDTGVGHLDLNEYTSGVFYRYFNVDRNQLRTNWSDLSEPDATVRLMEFYKALLLALPSGRTSSTAPRTIPSLVILQQSSLPLSYADAFEAPVMENGRGFTAPSRARLTDYSARAHVHAPAQLGSLLTLDLVSPDDKPVTFTDLATFATEWTLGTNGDVQ